MNNLMMNTLIVSEMSSTTNLATLRLLYLDACEVLQINPLVLHDREFLSKRISTAKSYYKAIINELLIIKAHFPYKQKALQTKYPRHKAKKMFRALKEAWQSEYSYIDEAHKTLLAAELFFLHDTETYLFIYHNLMKAAQKKYFLPDPRTVQKKWRPLKTYSNLKINQERFKKAKRIPWRKRKR